MNKWDMITFPPKVWRPFEVASDEIGWFLAVLDPHTVFEGKDPYWTPAVVQQAAELGFSADASGKMVKPDDYDARRQAHERTLLEQFSPDGSKPDVKS